MNEALLRETARTIFLDSLAACSIERSFQEKIKGVDQAAASLLFGNQLIDFSQLRYLRIVAVGKAAAPMVHALLRRLPNISECELSGILITPFASVIPEGFDHFPGGHPFPNEHSFAGARKVLQLLRELPPDASPENALTIFLLSGGASSMMELPLDAKITLEETIAFHRALVHSGASITEMNCVRKHFSAVKGGRLGLAVRPASSLTILVSDVPAGKADAIGSGPTLPDASTIEDCRGILAKFSLLRQFPLSVQRFFNSGNLPGTVQGHELCSPVWTILSADDMAEAARNAAERLGFRCEIDNYCDDWDYRNAAEYLLDRARKLRTSHGRVCLISAGEIAVRTWHEPGLATNPIGNGGRNQHFALYTATLLEASDIPIAVLSAGTDGIDGHSDAAGAVIGAETLRGCGQVCESGRKLRELAEQALANFNSSVFLESVNARLVTRPTGNNLRDLRLFLADR